MHAVIASLGKLFDGLFTDDPFAEPYLFILSVTEERRSVR